MSERLNVRRMVFVGIALLGGVACSAGRGDTIEACSDDWDNEPSGIVVGPDGVLSGYNNFTFDRLVEVTNNDDYGEDSYSLNWVMGDPVNKPGELACYQGDTLLLSSEGADALVAYIEQRDDESDCESLHDNPSYNDLDIDC